jgi:hypothetical protein
MKILFRLIALMILLPFLPKIIYRFMAFITMLHLFLPAEWVSSFYSITNFESKCIHFYAIEDGKAVIPKYHPEWKIKQTLSDCNRTIQFNPKLADAYISRALVREHYGDKKGAATDRCHAKKVREARQKEIQQKLGSQVPMPQIVGIADC